MGRTNICPVCWLCIDGEAPLTDKLGVYKHHISVSSLYRSVQYGCHFCTRFWQIFDARTHDLLINDPALFEFVMSDGLHLLLCQCNPTWTSAELDGFEDGTYFFSLYMPLWPDSAVLNTIFPHPRPAERPSCQWFFVPAQDLEDGSGPNNCDPGPQTTIDLAKHWLEICTATHDLCKRDSTLWRPTRLLDIRYAESQHCVKLVAGTEASQEPYNTLSHRWGSADFLQLNRDTKQKLEEGIDIGDLPLTFRDAINASRAMNVSFLWIDSLCIHQDSIPDWMDESGQMNEVYLSAYCNIGATAGSPPGERLLPYDRHKLLDRTWFEKTPSERSWTLEAGRYNVMRDGYWKDELHDAPLHKRAWVIQERFLARRILHFTEKEVMWECRELTASESWPEGIPGAMQVNFKHFGVKDLAGHRDIKYSHYHRIWREVVAAYSAAELTYADDRTIAISGVSKFLQPLLDDEYVFGMWRKTLLQNLLWFVTTREHRSVRNKRLLPIPPSYSWMSIENSVRFWNFEQAYLRNDDFVAQALNTPVDYPDQTTQRRLIDHSSTHLLLKGYLRKVELSSNQHLGRDPLDGHSYWEASMTGLPVGCDFFPDFGREELPFDSTGRQIYLFPILRADEQLVGLVLEPLEGCDLFRRIASFSVWYEDILKPQVHQAIYPCESYDAATKQHVIRLC